MLEKYIDKDTKRFRNTSKEAFENDIHEYIEKYVNEQLGGRFSKKSSFDYFLNLLERTLLNVLENMKKEFDECSFVPSGFESRITINVDTLDNDRIINFCGTADRIDTYQDGNAKYVRIIDYKTGNKSKEDIAMHTLVIGINMQLFMYLFMITDSKKGKYKDYEPGGALYYRIAMPSLEKKREIPDERIEKIKEKTHKMFGMVNSSGAVLQAMEKSQKGIFSPSPNNQYDVNNRNDNDIYQFMDEHMIDGMRELSFRLVRDMGENIFSGNIPAYPTFLGNLENSFDDERDYDSIQCEKCDYKEICAYGKDVEIHYLDKEKIDNDVNAIVGGDIDE